MRKYQKLLRTCLGCDTLETVLLGLVKPHEPCHTYIVQHRTFMTYRQLLELLQQLTEEQLNEVVYITNRWNKDSEQYGWDLILDLDTSDHD